MLDKELEQALIESNIELIKEVLNDMPRKSPEEAAKEWFKNLDVVKFSDWGKDLFKHSIPIKELEIPSELFINYFENESKAEHKLINYLQRLLNKSENRFFHNKNHIKHLFIKLESRSPKDYLQEYPKETLKSVINAQDIIDALLGSLRTFEDLCFLVKLSNTIKLYIRPFTYMYRPFEWRVFVKDNKVIGISQQFYNKTFDFENYYHKYLDSVQNSILYFMNNTCIPNIKVKDFVADLYVKDDNYHMGKNRLLPVTIIETNPYGLSDPCLFKSYKELESTNITFRYNK